MDAVDSYIPTPDRDDRQAVFDADRGCIYDIGTRDGSNRKSREGNGQGRRRGRDSRIGRDEEDGSNGSGDVQEDA